MAAIYTKGETKVRPGVYQRYGENVGKTVAGATVWNIGVAIQSDWGPVNSVVGFPDAVKKIDDVYGNVGNVEVAQVIADVAPNPLYVVRIGSGGTKGTVTLTDNAEAPADVVTLTAKYEGKRELSVTVRDKLSDSLVKEFIVYEGSTALENITFEKGADEPAALTAAVNDRSKYFDAAKTNDGSGIVGNVLQKEITVGTNPTVDNESYANALTALEPYKVNIIAVDSDVKSVHLLVHAFVERVFESGTPCIGVVGEPTSVEFDVRCEDATSYNDNKMVYVGGSFVDSNGKTVEGNMAAALVAGIIASTPTNESIVHRVVATAADTTEKLTNSQYVKAINSGMLLFSNNGTGDVWIDSGVNTLTRLSENQDEGWKKIKRTMIRLELTDRIDRTLMPLIGKINCDKDGVANIEQVAGLVLAAMANENKIMAGGTFIEDPENIHIGDSAWFLIDVDDIDSLEKIYLNYHFRFSTN